VGSLPPSKAPGTSSYSRLRGATLRVCQTRCLTFCPSKKGEAIVTIEGTTKATQKSCLQARVEESVKTHLERYAEFIDASSSYVIREALKLLFRKDDDFKRWAEQHTNNYNNQNAKGDVFAKAV
jgi:predicted transcriptional regulator